MCEIVNETVVCTTRLVPLLTACNASMAAFLIFATIVTTFEWVVSAALVKSNRTTWGL